MPAQSRSRAPAEAAGFAMFPRPIFRSARLSSAAKVAYILLRDYARQDGFAFPGMPTLARLIPASERSLRGYLKELAALGLITIERRGQGRTNRYWIEN